MEYFKIVGPVQAYPDGRTVVRVEVEFNASDWLCKAMAMLITRTKEGTADQEHLPKYEDLQKEVVKVWEEFRP